MAIRWSIAHGSLPANKACPNMRKIICNATVKSSQTYLSLHIHDADLIGLVTDYKLICRLWQEVYTVNSDIDCARSSSKSFKRMQAFRGLDIPDFDCAIRACRDNLMPVHGIHSVVDKRGVARELFNQLS